MMIYICLMKTESDKTNEKLNSINNLDTRTLMTKQLFRKKRLR